MSYSRCSAARPLCRSLSAWLKTTTEADRRAAALPLDDEHSLDESLGRQQRAVLSGRPRFLEPARSRVLGARRATARSRIKVQSGARHARLRDTIRSPCSKRAGRGLNCGLGIFEPLSRDAAESLLGGQNPRHLTSPVELPKDDAAGREPARPSRPAPPRKRPSPLARPGPVRARAQRPSVARMSRCVIGRSGFGACTDMMFAQSSPSRSRFATNTCVPTTGGFGTGG